MQFVAYTLVYTNRKQLKKSADEFRANLIGSICIYWGGKFNYDGSPNELQFEICPELQIHWNRKKNSWWNQWKLHSNLLVPTKYASICCLKFLWMRFNRHICGYAIPKQQQINRQLAFFPSANTDWVCVSIVFMLSAHKSAHKVERDPKKKGAMEMMKIG